MVIVGGGVAGLARGSLRGHANVGVKMAEVTGENPDAQTVTTSTIGSYLMRLKSKVATITRGKTDIGKADEAAAGLSVRVGRGGSVGGLYEQ